MKSIDRTLTFLLAVIAATAVYGQAPKGVYWLRYQNQLAVRPDFNWNNEIDNRRFFKPDVETLLIMHSRVQYNLKRWQFGGGLTFSWSYSQSPEAKIKHATNEVRPVVEVNYEIPLKRWSIAHRLRLDNRFIEEDKFQTVFDGSNYIARLRYRLQFEFPLKQTEGSGSMNVRLANEIMINHRENRFDQDRIYATLDYRVSKKISLEMGYVYIYQQRFGQEEFLKRNVLRLSLIHRIFLYH